MLDEEIEKAKVNVKTDAYQMSVGEIVNMYENREIIIDPEFQRLFRWEISQKSKLIESLLLGIPIPSIFVFERDDGTWELVDGLQRLSTILEFMGRLRDEDGLAPPSVLEGTKYLPSLHNTVWEEWGNLKGVAANEERPLEKHLQLYIRRARFGVQILKRPSPEQTKYDLFQRLNAGGTPANPQELRNCIMLMVNAEYFRAVKTASDQTAFTKVTGFTDDQKDRQKHMEYAIRFLVHTFIEYDGHLDVEEYIDEGAIALAKKGDSTQAVRLMADTFDLLDSAAGEDALRRYDGSRHTGKIGLVGLEGIAVGVARNMKAIKELGDPKEFVKTKLQTFWRQPETQNVTVSGVRGTTRIQRTVPFGAVWFRP